MVNVEIPPIRMMIWWLVVEHKSQQCVLLSFYLLFAKRGVQDRCSGR